jgi:hypothetical protein
MTPAAPEPQAFGSLRPPQAFPASRGPVLNCDTQIGESVMPVSCSSAK